jgi:hypothetical protein
MKPVSAAHTRPWESVIAPPPALTRIWPLGAAGPVAAIETPPTGKLAATATPNANTRTLFRYRKLGMIDLILCEEGSGLIGFDSPARCFSSVALRPYLATGLPLSTNPMGELCPY